MCGTGPPPQGLPSRPNAALAGAFRSSSLPCQGHPGPGSGWREAPRRSAGVGAGAPVSWRANPCQPSASGWAVSASVLTDAALCGVWEARGSKKGEAGE